ncbi:uncharacterized protein LOC105380261 isoform X2 [Plutella xylostella]|uniref:uncharacterized protein LOC105380261 isoform X2 n=1 Tax=Plutella xylostella TaxID=51655 RepID=UPI00203234FD|nr:uncharacterized protein LOC105380261 isoform X2 [Plutella xylostella]
MKSYSSSTFNDDLPPDYEILTEGSKSSWNGNYRISGEGNTEKPILNNKKKMNKFKPFSLGPQLHNETVQIEKRQVDDDDHDDVSSLEKIEDADDSGEIEFVEPKEALLDSLGVPENKSPDQEVSIPEELSNNEDINFVEKSADIERNIADIQEQIPQENNEFKILYGNAVIEPTQPTYGFIPNAIEFNTAQSIITSTEEKTETVRGLKVTAATTIKETVNIINDAEDVGNIMNLKIAETSTRRNNWRKFNDSSWKPNRYLKKALLHKLNRNKTSTYKDVNVKPSASPAHPKKALFYAKVNKYTPSDDDDDDDDDDVKIRITKQDKHRHLDELYDEEDATTKNEMLNISGVPNIVQDSTKKDSYIMKLISNVDRQRAVTRTTEAATVEDISEHHSALDKLIHLERKYQEAISSTTVKPPVTKSSERKSKYSKKGVIYKHYEYTTPEANDNTDLDTEVEVKPLQHLRPKDSKAGFFKSFPMKYTVSDDDEPTINPMKKTEDASDYFDYQQTVIISNRTITYDQDYSNGETTTRYIIPNRTKSADHDFSNEETTTRYTRTVSKIIQYFDYQQTAIIPNRTVTAEYINDETTRYLIPKRTKSSEHNFNYGETTTQYSRTVSKTIQNLDLDETTLQPVVKPTRVRLKPSRPIHKYDTTTQMKWRSDFTKKKQDVLENSTTSKGYIEIISLKNHDFLQSKLNLSSYEREDQMKEEMFSTDRVDRAKQFSMPDNFANWKPESDIANAAAVPKNKYFDYQQTVIIPNRSITTDKDYSNNVTTRYIIPNRTKSDYHDFKHDETTTQFTRTFSKIIQNINYNETTLQPIVKPTRVRHKPSRPIHKYDTTTQMKWRRDFITQKQDVLENSTTPKPNIEIIKLKKHDFLHSKLNLSPYEREDQMNEEMLSTDRVVGRKRTETYFDYQQTVIIPNRTLTTDQDYSNDETTTRYIIPNRTKSDYHDFKHDETTTQFSRTFSKIIQNINHNETTQHPTVKPTRVRHKPSRPIHKYDTTTQMKWRSDFTKKKQDVLENSTIGNINTLKNHDFLHSKLNLPSYLREDQMIEEMFSTDRVVGRKRTKTVSVDAKRFSMPDNFANWKPELKIANFVTKNKNYHSVSPENRRKLTSPIVVPTRTPIADNIVTVADRQTTTIHPKTIEPVVEITETRNLIIPTRTRTKKIFKKKHHYALPRIKIVTITPIKIPNRTKTLEYYIIPNVTATSSMYPKTAFSKDIAKSSQTNIMIPTRIRTKSVAKKFSQFLPSTIKTRKETGTTQHYTVPNRTKPMDDQHFSEDESTSQLTGTFSKVINKKSHLLTSRKPTKARTTLQYAIIPNRTEPIIVDYSNGRTTKYTRTFNFSRIPKKSHLLTSVSRTKVRTSLQYAMVPNRPDPIIYDQNYNSERSAMAEYTTGNLSEVTKKSLHQTSRSSNKAKSKISLTLLLPTITRTAKQHYSNNGEPTLHATKFSRIAKKLHRLTSRLPTKGKVSRKSSLQNKIFPPRTLTILGQHYITQKITTSTRKTSKMSKYTHGPFISTKQTITGTKQQYENLPGVTRTKEISSTDYKSRYLSTRLYDFVTEATLLPKRKPYKTSHVMQYETIQTKSTMEEPPTYITLTLTEDYKTREDVTTTEAFTEISEEYFNITYTIPTRTIGVIDQYTFILKPTKMSIVPQRTTGNLNNIKRNFGSKSKVRPNKNGLVKSKSHTNLDYNKTPGTIRTQNHFTKKFGLTRTSYQQALTRDRHKYKIGLTRPGEGQEIGPTRSTINAEYHYPTRTIDSQEYYTKTFGPTRLEPIRWTKKLYNGPTRTHMPEEESILHKIFKTTRTYYHADTKKLNDYLGYYTIIPRRKYKHKTDKHTFHDIPSKRSSSWTNMLAEHKTNDDSHDYSQREEKTEQQKPNSDKEEDSDSGEKNPNLDKYENSDTGVQNPHLVKEENSNMGEQNPNLDKGDNSDDTDTGETPNLNKEEQKSISPPIEQEEYKATAVQPDERANKFRLTRTTYKFKIVPTRTRQQHFRIMEGGHRPLNKNIQLNLDSSEERAFLFDNRNSILANSDKNEKKLKEIPVSFGKTRVMDDLESIEDVKFEFENVTEAPADYEIGRVTQIVSEATDEPDSYESLMKRINVLTPYPDAPALQSTKLGGFDDEETPRNSPKPKFKIKLKLDQTNKDKANEKEEIPDDVFPKYEELQAGPDEPPPQTDPAVPQPTEPQTTESDTETTEESSTESNETSTEPVPSDPCEVADNFLKKDLQNKTILPVPFTRTGVAIGTKLLTFALVVLVLRQAT